MFRGASYPLPEDGNDESGGGEVCDADVRQTEEVRADAEDEDVADVAEVRECCGGHDGRDRAGREEDRALKESDRARGRSPRARTHAWASLESAPR